MEAMHSEAVDPARLAIDIDECPNGLDHPAGSVVGAHAALPRVGAVEMFDPEHLARPEQLDPHDPRGDKDPPERSLICGDLGDHELKATASGVREETTPGGTTTIGPGGADSITGTGSEQPTMSQAARIRLTGRAIVL
jgi:hypothetical protein